MTITSSYIATLMYELRDELLRAMGYPDAEDYADPEYLQLRAAVVSSPIKTLRVAADTDTPVAQIVFIESRPVEYAIGGAGGEGSREDMFMVYLMAVFTPSILGLEEYDADDFAIAADASAHELAQRVMTVLRNFVPNVYDNNWGWATSSHRIGRYSLYPKAADWLIEYRIAIEYLMMSEKM